MAETKTHTSPDVEGLYEAETISADGAISIKNGLVIITKGTAAALTLAAPTSGADDGKRLTIIDSTGAAHTVTTPTNGINGNKHIATFGGTVGGYVSLHAQGGVWYSPVTAASLS